MNPNPLEKAVEAGIRKYAVSRGVLCYKFTSPAQRHVPDRLLIYGGRVWFMEIKRRGEKPTAAQAIEHAKMRANGAKVYVVDNVEAGKVIVDMEMMS
jgi:hypothetical protein